MTIELTREKIAALGVRVAGLMLSANNPDSPSLTATESRLDGILFALNTLGIPHKEHWNGEEVRYIAVEIADEIFYV